MMSLAKRSLNPTAKATAAAAASLAPVAAGQGGSLMTAGNFKAMAQRSDGWWALEVTGDDLPYPAYTQARRLDQAEVVVRDLLALHFGTREDAVGRIEIVPVLDAALAEEVSQTRDAREQAERLRADASRPDTANGSAPERAGDGPARHQRPARHIASSRKPAPRELKTVAAGGPGRDPRRGVKIRMAPL
jgi:hypothetical protein